MNAAVPSVAAPPAASPRRRARKSEAELVSQIPRIAVAIETRWIQGRQIVQGILRYVRLRDPWEIRLFNPDEPLRRQLDFKTWKPSGIISRGYFADDCAAANVPVVFCDFEYEWKRGPGLPWSGRPEVRVDDLRVGKVGAEHFLRRGYRNLAYCGSVDDYAYSLDRARGFCERAAVDEIVPFVYETPPARQKKWEREQLRLARWLRSLPKPVGLMAANDLRAQQILATCDACGFDVPSDVAVLGVDADELFCALSGVSLSSIPIDSFRGGFTAARLLDETLRGAAVPPVVYSPPLEIVARKSTDFYPVDDDAVAEAIRYINMNVNRPISANLVARRVDLSRRALNFRFEKATRTTVHQYIVSAKTDRIANLLRVTSWPLRKIAEQTGFNSAAYLCEFFFANVGQTPGEYRRQNVDAFGGPFFEEN